VTVDGDREATKNIAPGQPVTDANSRLMGSGLRKTVTMPIYGEDGTIRSFTFEVPLDTDIPPGAFIHTRGRTTEESPVKYPIDVERELAIERAHAADLNARLTTEIQRTDYLRRDIEGLMRDLLGIGELLGLPAVMAPETSMQYVLALKEKLRGYLGDLRYLQDRTHNAEDKAKDDRERINLLETDVNMVELERDARKTDLAELRTEFAAEVQKVQRLEHRLMLAQESSLATIGALVEELQKR
jgi:hypothetical protein